MGHPPIACRDAIDESRMQNAPPSGNFAPMRDVDIRAALRRHLAAACADDPTTLILDELGVCSGSVRVDMAVVNGALKGFEIKSDSDTLDRLANQANAYNKVFDTLSVVVEKRHLSKVRSMVPAWWGIHIANARENGAVDLESVRRERLNHRIDAASLVQLLWRDETLALLQSIGAGVGIRKKPRRYLWEALTTSVALVELREMVRRQLKSRQGWRSVSPPTQGDAKSQPSSKLSDSPM
jgi:hypothetical protein